MKILLSGYHNPNYLTVTEYIERAIRSLGHELFVFNDRNHIIPGRLRRRLAWLQSISLAAINLNLVRMALRTKPDLILITGGHRVALSTLQKLRKYGFHLALWATDPPRISDIMLVTGAFYHHLFCQGTEYRDVFQRMGLAQAEWLPMACDPQIHRRVEVPPEERQQLGSPVVFMGSYYPCRMAPLEKARLHGLAIWGPGWEALPSGSPLSACVRSAHTRPDMWKKIYATSKIVLSIHYRDSENQFSVHQASPRVFEAMACGAFVLTDRQKDVLTLFKDGEHLATFSDGDDLDHKIAYYLEHAAERERIAAAGRQEVLMRHTYAQRLQSLLDRIKAGAQVHSSLHSLAASSSLPSITA
jgi:spore maturation protein CgeB